MTSQIQADVEQLRHVAQAMREFNAVLHNHHRGILGHVNGFLSAMFRGNLQGLLDNAITAFNPEVWKISSTATDFAQRLEKLATALEDADSKYVRPNDTLCIDIADPKAKQIPKKFLGFTYGHEDTVKYQRFEGKLFIDGARANDVKQGALGDCYFVAALAAIAQQHPELIERAIRYDGNGVYSITFYENGKTVEIQIDTDFPAQNGVPLYAQTGSAPQELWVMLMEKAYAQYRGSYPEIEGGFPEEAVSLITGKAGQRFDSAPSIQELNTRLQKGEILTAASLSKGDAQKISSWPEWMISSHAYSISSVDVERGTITLRNPWGQNHPHEMTLAEYNTYFQYTGANP